MQIEKTMMLITSKIEGIPTFRAIPVHKDCPYNEMSWHPVEKMLGIVSKQLLNRPDVFEKWDENGDILAHKKKRNEYARERKLVDVPYEYGLSNPEEIKELLELMCINHQQYDYQKYLTAKKVEKSSEFSAKIEG